MTPQDCVQILAYFAEAYPTTPAPPDPTARARVWADSLAGFEPEQVMAAARSWVANGNRFMPNLGEMHETIRDTRFGAVPSEAEAWAVCTSSASTAEVHPMLRKVVQITGGRNTLAWLPEADARRSVRGAYYQALRQFQISSQPDELPQRSLDQRRGGAPQPIGPMS